MPYIYTNMYVFVASGCGSFEGKWQESQEGDDVGYRNLNLLGKLPELDW